MEGILNYKTPSVSHVSKSALGTLNLCRDLSLTNRKNHEHTTRKGVPLVYHTKVTVYRTQSTDTDEEQKLFFYTVPQNWVYRNAAVKLHYAREAMMRNNGITKSERGRYDHTIRYGWDNTDMTDGHDGWLDPVDWDGNAYVQGTWDTTELFLADGTEIGVTLHGGIADNLEDTSDASGQRSLASMYLQSRNLIREDDSDDTDLEGDGAEDEFPAEFSIIRQLFGGNEPARDDVLESVQTSQDNPPYDVDDLTEDASFISPVEQGRSITGLQSNVKDVLYLDVPFGIMDLKGIIANASASRVIDFQVEVLGVSEMQG